MGSRFVVVPVSAALIVSFFLSDYGFMLGGRIVVAGMSLLWLLGFVILKAEHLSIKRYIPPFVSLMGSLLLLNTMLGIGFNFVVFVPIIAYMVFSLYQGERQEEILEKIALSVLYLMVVPIVVAEVLVKLSVLDIGLVRELIVGTGDGRIDVLRVKSPFGSPLSLASFAFALIVYFTLFSRRKLEILVLLILLIMTGSRTALAASVALLVGHVVMPKLLTGALRPFNLPKALGVAVSGCAVFVGAVIYLEKIGMGNSVSRVLSIQSYDVTRDASFLSRGDTTLSVLSDVLSDLPRSLLLGQEVQGISDSAFVSIAAQSGVIAAVAFFALFYRYAGRMRASELDRVIFVGLFTLLAAMVGDAVVPLVTFFYFLMFYTYGAARRPVQSEQLTFEDSGVAVRREA